MTPKVSIVVPCYKLAHLLGECITSILAQTYTDFELIIMDDHSPDDVAEVVNGFNDRRIQYVRNPQNLGNVKNYNAGISKARGEYIWLVSADDRLRASDALEKYVQALEAHPEVGFACCPAVELAQGREVGVVKYSVVARHDTIFAGHEFLQLLLDRDVVIASAAIVRRSCYDRLGLFRVDLPYANDWHMWCLIALHYAVAYVAEPMVNYRSHELSMTRMLMDQNIRTMANDNLSVLWQIKHRAELLKGRRLMARCVKALAYEYGRQIMGDARYASYRMTWDEARESVRRHAVTDREARAAGARIWIAVGDKRLERDDVTGAKKAYKRALGENPMISEAWGKLSLLELGNFGVWLRRRRFDRLRRRNEVNLIPAIQPASIESFDESCGERRAAAQH